MPFIYDTHPPMGTLYVGNPFTEFSDGQAANDIMNLLQDGMGRNINILIDKDRRPWYKQMPYIDARVQI